MVQVSEENGIKVITEYRHNDEGKRIKVVRKVRLVPHRERVCHAAAVRSKWKRFGASSNSSSFDDGRTVVTDEISLDLLTLKDINDGVGLTKSAAQPTKKPTNVSVMCRICKGEHWTTKCPYKDTLSSLEDLLETSKSPSANSTSTTPIPGQSASVAPEDSTKSGRYVPPSLRAKMAAGGSAGPSAGGSSFDSYMRRDEDGCSLRISNLSEDTTDDDLRHLFSPFGHMSRCFLAKDRDTGVCKGFAFVGYHSKSDAEKALKVMNGKGFDSLILKVEWSAPRKP